MVINNDNKIEIQRKAQIAIQKASEKRRNRFIKFLCKYPLQITVACKKANITCDTYYAWRKKYPDFAKQVETTRDRFLDLVESKFVEKIKEGNLQAIMFALKHLGKKRGYLESLDIKQEIKGINEIKVSFKDPNQKAIAPALPKEVIVDVESEDRDIIDET